ncbi:hypothetical protein [Domibacillus antri]|nr:hypothetical protein [Domibacillus antri]
MYNFIMIQWVLGRYTEEQVKNAVTKAYINQEQCDTIINTPKAI